MTKGDIILELLAKGPRVPERLMSATGQTRVAFNMSIMALRKQGYRIRFEKGMYHA